MAGLFIKRLVDELVMSGEVVSVLTPASARGSSQCPNVISFKYMPSFLPGIAQVPGGIPESVKKNKANYVWLCCLFLCMFVQLLKLGRRYDLIVANWTLTGVVSGLAGKLLNKPTITVIRGSDVNSSSRLSKLIAWATLTISDRVVCVNEVMANQLANAFPDKKNKIKIITNGVSDTFYQIGRTRPPERPLVNDIRRVVTVGNLTLNKNIELIMTALSKLRKSGEKVQLHVVGDGPLRDELKQKASEKEMGDSVLFRGALDEPEIAGLLLSADVFVLASHSEGRSNALCEAMAANLPVLASDIPANRSLVKHGISGCLFDPLSDSELSGQVLRYIRDPVYASSLAWAGHEEIKQLSGTWSDCAQKYISLIEDILPKYE